MWDITTMTRNEMILELQKRECRVIFTKVNGEERNMICTLQESVIPAPKTESKDRKVNENTIVAWDVNKDAYRSFRVENVVSFT